MASMTTTNNNTIPPNRTGAAGSSPTTTSMATNYKNNLDQEPGKDMSSAQKMVGMIMPQGVEVREPLGSPKLVPVVQNAQNQRADDQRAAQQPKGSTTTDRRGNRSEYRRDEKKGKSRQKGGSSSYNINPPPPPPAAQSHSHSSNYKSNSEDKQKNKKSEDEQKNKSEDKTQFVGFNTPPPPVTWNGNNDKSNSNNKNSPVYSGSPSSGDQKNNSSIVQQPEFVAGTSILQPPLPGPVVGVKTATGVVQPLLGGGVPAIMPAQFTNALNTVIGSAAGIPTPPAPVMMPGSNNLPTTSSNYQGQVNIIQGSATGSLPPPPAPPTAPSGIPIDDHGTGLYDLINAHPNLTCGNACFGRVGIYRVHTSWHSMTKRSKGGVADQRGEWLMVESVDFKPESIFEKMEIVVFGTVKNGARFVAGTTTGVNGYPIINGAALLSANGNPMRMDSAQTNPDREVGINGVSGVPGVEKTISAESSSSGSSSAKSPTSALSSASGMDDDLQLIFEPFYLDVECRTLVDAKAVLRLSQKNGYRESHISSIKEGFANAKNRSSIVHIRGSDALKLNVPFRRRMITRSYLQYLVRFASDKFSKSKQRLENFSAIMSAEMALAIAADYQLDMAQKEQEKKAARDQVREEMRLEVLEEMRLQSDPSLQIANGSPQLRAPNPLAPGPIPIGAPNQLVGQNAIPPGMQMNNPKQMLEQQLQPMQPVQMQMPMVMRPPPPNQKQMGGPMQMQMNSNMGMPMNIPPGMQNQMGLAPPQNNPPMSMMQGQMQGQMLQPPPPGGGLPPSVIPNMQGQMQNLNPNANMQNLNPNANMQNLNPNANMQASSKGMSSTQGMGGNPNLSQPLSKGGANPNLQQTQGNPNLQQTQANSNNTIPGGANDPNTMPNWYSAKGVNPEAIPFVPGTVPGTTTTGVRGPIVEYDGRILKESDSVSTISNKSDGKPNDYASPLDYFNYYTAFGTVRGLNDYTSKSSTERIVGNSDLGQITTVGVTKKTGLATTDEYSPYGMTQAEYREFYDLFSPKGSKKGEDIVLSDHMISSKSTPGMDESNVLIRTVGGENHQIQEVPEGGTPDPYNRSDIRSGTSDPYRTETTTEVYTRDASYQGHDDHDADGNRAIAGYTDQQGQYRSYSPAARGYYDLHDKESTSREYESGRYVDGSTEYNDGGYATYDGTYLSRGALGGAYRGQELYGGQYDNTHNNTQQGQQYGGAAEFDQYGNPIPGTGYGAQYDEYGQLVHLDQYGVNQYEEYNTYNIDKEPTFNLGMDTPPTKQDPNSDKILEDGRELCWYLSSEECKKWKPIAVKEEIYDRKCGIKKTPHQGLYLFPLIPDVMRKILGKFAYFGSNPYSEDRSLFEESFPEIHYRDEVPDKLLEHLLAMQQSQTLHEFLLPNFSDFLLPISPESSGVCSSAASSSALSSYRDDAVKDANSTSTPTKSGTKDKNGESKAPKPLASATQLLAVEVSNSTGNKKNRGNGSDDILKRLFPSSSPKEEFEQHQLNEKKCRIPNCYQINGDLVCLPGGEWYHECLKKQPLPIQRHFWQQALKYFQLKIKKITTIGLQDVVINGKSIEDPGFIPGLNIETTPDGSKLETRIDLMQSQLQGGRRNSNVKLMLRIDPVDELCFEKHYLSVGVIHNNLRTWLNVNMKQVVKLDSCINVITSDVAYVKPRLKQLKVLPREKERETRLKEEKKLSQSKESDSLLDSQSAQDMMKQDLSVISKNTVASLDKSLDKSVEDNHDNTQNQLRKTHSVTIDELGVSIEAMPAGSFINSLNAEDTATGKEIKENVGRNYFSIVSSTGGECNNANNYNTNLRPENNSNVNMKNSLNINIEPRKLFFAVYEPRMMKGWVKSGKENGVEYLWDLTCPPPRRNCLPNPVLGNLKQVLLEMNHKNSSGSGGTGGIPSSNINSTTGTQVLGGVNPGTIGSSVNQRVFGNTSFSILYDNLSEKLRVSRDWEVQRGEIIVDMFCGIGDFALPLLSLPVPHDIQKEEQGVLEGHLGQILTGSGSKMDMSGKGSKGTASSISSTGGHTSMSSQNQTSQGGDEIMDGHNNYEHSMTNASPGSGAFNKSVGFDGVVVATAAGAAATAAGGEVSSRVAPKDRWPLVKKIYAVESSGICAEALKKAFESNFGYKTFYIVAHHILDLKLKAQLEKDDEFNDDGFKKDANEKLTSIPPPVASAMLRRRGYVEPVQRDSEGKIKREPAAKKEDVEFLFFQGGVSRNDKDINGVVNQLYHEERRTSPQGSSFTARPLSADAQAIAGGSVGVDDRNPLEIVTPNIHLPSMPPGLTPQAVEAVGAPGLSPAFGVGSPAPPGFLPPGLPASSLRGSSLPSGLETSSSPPTAPRGVSDTNNVTVMAPRLRSTQQHGGEGETESSGPPGGSLVPAPGLLLGDHETLNSDNIIHTNPTTSKSTEKSEAKKSDDKDGGEKRKLKKERKDKKDGVNSEIEDARILNLFNTELLKNGREGVTKFLEDAEIEEFIRPYNEKEKISEFKKKRTSDRKKLTKLEHDSKIDPLLEILEGDCEQAFVKTENQADRVILGLVVSVLNGFPINNTQQYWSAGVRNLNKTFDIPKLDSFSPMEDMNIIKNVRTACRNPQDNTTSNINTSNHQRNHQGVVSSGYYSGGGQGHHSNNSNRKSIVDAKYRDRLEYRWIHVHEIVEEGREKEFAEGCRLWFEKQINRNARNNGTTSPSTDKKNPKNPSKGSKSSSTTDSQKSEKNKTWVVQVYHVEKVKTYGHTKLRHIVVDLRCRVTVSKEELHEV